MSGRTNEAPLFIEPANDPNLKRGIFNAIIAPRPIGWISSLDRQGQPNLAPFSYFNIVSNHPAILMFSCNTPEDRDKKDTAANVRATGEFVFNLVSYDLVEAMNHTSTPVPPGTDEFEVFGIEKAPCVHVSPPRVARAAVAMECKVIQHLTFGGGDKGPETDITFGEVVGMHIAPGYVNDAGHFDTRRANPVARLGGADYGLSNETFTLQRQFTRANEAKY